MNRYTIYCTEEQTKKALELGASLETRTNKNPFINVGFFNSRGQLVSESYDIPSAEQMLGWIEEQGLIIHIIHPYKNGGYWIFYIQPTDVRGTLFASRKEATLAAIDAALEYLIKTKEEIK